MCCLFAFYCPNLTEKQLFPCRFDFLQLNYSSFFKQQKQEPLVKSSFATWRQPQILRQTDLCSGKCLIWQTHPRFLHFPVLPRSAHDLLYSFSAEHQVLFSMAASSVCESAQSSKHVGCLIEAIAHWLISVWEDLQNWCHRLVEVYTGVIVDIIVCLLVYFFWVLLLRT